MPNNVTVKDRVTLKEAGVVLSTSESATLCRVINHYGNGDHPFAEVWTLDYFDCKYVAQCCDRAAETATAFASRLRAAAGSK